MSAPASAKRRRRLARPPILPSVTSTFRRADHRSAPAVADRRDIAVLSVGRQCASIRPRRRGRGCLRRERGPARRGRCRAHAATTVGAAVEPYQPHAPGKRARGITAPGLIWSARFGDELACAVSPAARRAATTEQRRQTSRAGYCTAPQSRQNCSSSRAARRRRRKAKGEAAAQRPAAGLAAACAGSGFALAATDGATFSCAARVNQRQARRRRAQAAIVVDHAEAAHQRMARVGTGAPSFARQLPHRLDQAEIAAGRAGLPDRQLPAAGVDAERLPSIVKSWRRTKSGPFALAAEARPSNCSIEITG